MQDLLQIEFGLITEQIRGHAQRNPGRLALFQGEQSLSYGQLEAAMDRVAATLQRAGLAVGDSIAICAATSIAYGVVFLGALRAG